MAIVLPSFGDEEEDGIELPSVESAPETSIKLPEFESEPETSINLPEFGSDEPEFRLDPETGAFTRSEESAFASFLDAFEGHGSVSEFIRDNSVLSKAGGMMLENAIKFYGGETGEQMVDENREINRQSRVYREWQPRIWAIEDQMAKLPKTSPQYQMAYEQLQDTRRNMAADVEGTYVPEDSEMNFGEIYDTIKENPGRMAGEVTKALVADPALLMVPAGALRAGAAATKATVNLGKLASASARVTAQMAGAGGTAALWGAGEDAITQLDENPEAPIDFDRVANSAMITGALGGAMPLVPAVGKGVMKGASAVNSGIKKLPTPSSYFDYSDTPMTIGESMDRKQIQKIQEDAQEMYLGSRNEEGLPTMTKQLAVEKSLAKHRGLDGDTKSGVIKSIDDYMNDASMVAAENRIANRGVVGKTVAGAKKATGAVYDTWNEISQPITSRLRNRGYGWIAAELNKHDMNVGVAIQERQQVVRNFSDQMKRLTKPERDEASFLLNTGRYDELADKHEFLRPSISSVREMLDDVYNEGTGAGMRIDYAHDYFPREMADYEGYLKSFGVSADEATDALHQRLNKKRKTDGLAPVPKSQFTQDFINQNFTQDEIGKVIGGLARKLDVRGDVAASKNVSPTKQRSILGADFTPEVNQYYADPVAALHNYVSRMTPKIADRKFFGGKELNRELGEYLDSDQAFEIYNDAFLTKNERLGSIAPEDRDFVRDMLRARFVGGNQKAPNGINVIKNMLYAMTLANPISATVQLGDVGASAFVAGRNSPKGFVDGFVNSFEGLGKIATNNRDFTMADMGLESIPELEAMDWSRQFLETGMKYSGFKAMDQLGKESILNANYAKLRKIMANEKTTEAQKRKEFEDLYHERLVGNNFPDEEADDLIGEIMEGVRSGDKTNEAVRLAMYSDLTRVQPISMSEMPAAYLNHPKARLAYMLKTFTLKQIDLTRQQIIKEFSEGVRNKDKMQTMGAMMAAARLAGTIGAANYGVQYMKDMISGKDDVTFTERATDVALRNYGLSEYSFNHLRRGRLDYFLAGMALPPVNAAVSPIDNAPIIGRPMKELGITNAIGEATGIEMLQD